MPGKVKAHELRKKTEQQLLEELTTQRKELAQLRVSKVSAAPQVKLAKIKQARKAIAKVLTVISEKRRGQAKEEYKSAKLQPLDLRQKGTRAFRRRLTKQELKKVSLRTYKIQSNFKPRKYALAE